MAKRYILSPQSALCSNVRSRRSNHLCTALKCLDEKSCALYREKPPLQNHHRYVPVDCGRPRWRREAQKGQQPRNHSRPTVWVTGCVETSEDQQSAFSNLQSANKTSRISVCVGASSC